MKDALGHGSDTRGGTNPVPQAGYGVHGEHVLGKVGTPLQVAVAGFQTAAGKWAQGILDAQSKVTPLMKLKSDAEINAEIAAIWNRK
jgi:hypothetical protein